MTRNRADAVLVLTSSMMIHDQGVAIATLAARHRLPIMSSWTYLTHSGGLMSYTSNSVEVVSRTADLVNRILKGAKPADLPVEQPTKFELVINLKTAKALGLTIPPSVLARADEVIQ
jgi:putative ABC transport system substrate-binding protein